MTNNLKVAVNQKYNTHTIRVFKLNFYTLVNNQIMPASVAGAFLSLGKFW